LIMNIVWLSANKLGYELLKEAVKLKDVNINAVITLSVESRIVMYDGIENHKWYEFGKKVYEIDKLNDKKDLVKRISPDLVIMCGWREVIDKRVLGIPKYGFIGFHPTLLPIGRGPAPIINSIMYGFVESGVTMYHVSGGLDDGDIVGQEGYNILESDYAEDVYKKAIKAGRKLIKIYLPKIIKGSAPRIPQDNTKVLIFKKPELKNNQIDLKKESVEEIYRKIRALSTPYKGAYIRKGGRKLIIWRAELE